MNEVLAALVLLLVRLFSCPSVGSPDYLLLLGLLWGSSEVSFTASPPGSLILFLALLPHRIQVH